jgi:hypothetical protein
MPVFRNSWMKAVVAVAVAVSFCGAAWAQQGKPVQLAPPKRLLPTPKSETPSDPAKPGVLQPAYKTGPRGQSLTTIPSVGARGIEVDRLQVVTPDSAGILTAENGGFGGDMWRGTTMSRAEAMLSGMPPRIGSRVLSGLVRRLLLSAARPPQGTATSDSLAVLRLRRLADMGDYAGALDLLSIMPRQGRVAALVRAEAELRFLSGDHIAACALVGNEVRRNQAAFWQKALAFCQLLSGQPEKAELGLTMLREVGEADESFFKLANAMISGETIPAGPLRRTSALELAALPHLNADIDVAGLATMAPGAVRMIALDERRPVFMRLAATEQAAKLGLFRDGALVKVYMKAAKALPAPDAALEEAWSEQDKRLAERARLIAAATHAKLAVAKAEAMSQALQSAANDGIVAATARLLKAELAEIPVSLGFKWFAALAFRSAAANSEFEKANAWLALLHRSAAMSEEDGVALKDIEPLAVLARKEDVGQNSPPVLSGLDAGRQVLVHALLTGLGQSVPPERWLQWADEPASESEAPMPPPALWLALKAMNADGNKDEPLAGESLAGKSLAGESIVVAQSQVSQTTQRSLATAVTTQQLGAPTAGTRSDIDHKAERVLLMIRVMGGASPGQVNPVVLGEVVRGLFVLGFKSEARALAIEAALEAGL